MKMNHYELLNVAPNASRKEIRDKFLSLSRSLHTDKNDNTGHLFSAVKHAYDTLIDQQKRREYDMTHLANQAQNQRDSRNSYGRAYEGAAMRGALTPFSGFNDLFPHHGFFSAIDIQNDRYLSEQSKGGYVYVSQSTSKDGKVLNHTEKEFVNGHRKK